MNGAGEILVKRETVRKRGERGGERASKRDRDRETEGKKERVGESYMKRAICKGSYRICDLWQRDSVSSKQLFSEGARGISLFYLLQISCQVYSIC